MGTVLQVSEIWFGKAGTAYEGVTAKIEAITLRNVQVTYDRIVLRDGLQLQGEVMSKRRFQELFSPYQQMSLFDT